MTQPTITERVELIMKLALAGAGLLYGLGFAVVAWHNLRLGLPASRFLRSDYVLAGTWALTPFVVGLSMSLFSLGVSMVAPRWRDWRQLLLRVLLYGSLGAVLWFMAFRFLPNSATSVLSQHYGPLSRNMMWPFGFTLMSFWFLKLGHKGFAIVSIVFLLYTGLEYVLWFSETLYPELPRAIGGGAPLRITFTNDVAGTAERDFELLAEDDAALYLRALGTATVIVFPRSAVNGYRIHH